MATKERLDAERAVLAQLGFPFAEIHPGGLRIGPQRGVAATVPVGGVTIGAATTNRFLVQQNLGPLLLDEIFWPVTVTAQVQETDAAGAIQVVDASFQLEFAQQVDDPTLAEFDLVLPVIPPTLNTVPAFLNGRLNYSAIPRAVHAREGARINLNQPTSFVADWIFTLKNTDGVAGHTVFLVNAITWRKIGGVVQP